MATPCFASAAAVVLLLTAAVADGSKLGSKRHEPFDRYEDGHLEEPLLDDDYIHDQNDGLFDKMNSWYSTTTTTTTTTPKKHKKSSCVTIASPMDKVWNEELAPLKVAKDSSECVFGVDDRDEGGHCIHQNGKYGSYGWCFTKKDGSEWGSCNKLCPLYGQEKSLEDKIKELEEKLDRTRAKLIPELAKATAKADCMDCRAHSSLLGADAKVDCAKPCKGIKLSKSDVQKIQPKTKAARKASKDVALVEQGEEVTASRKQQRDGRAKVRSSRIAKLEARLAKTKEWHSFLMATKMPK